MKLLLSIMLLALLAIGAFGLWTPDKDRAWLERKYLVAPGDMVVVAGATLHVRDRGPSNAPVIILIHGFGASLQTWDALAHALETDHRVIRFDLPGSGLSPPDVTGNYTDARSIQLLSALQDHFELGKSGIVGHSIGGRMGWTFAALHPTRVEKLVLIAPDGFASPGFRYGESPKVPSMLRLMAYALPKPLLRANLVAAYADPAMLTDALTSRYHDLILAPGARQALLARMDQTVLVDPQPLLERIDAPTLLLWGERDGMIPIANAADYLASIKDVRLISIADSGHLPQEEMPERTVAAVRGFLKPR